MKKFIIGSLLSLAFVGVVALPQAQAEEMTIAEQIEALLAQLVELQNQLAQLKGDIREVIKDGLEQGMTDDDIAKVQELLATDPAIYPEGIVSGYFGNLTKNALIRFQLRHGANPTGEIDEETQELLEEYLSEGFGDNIPPGLLRAPGIIKKVELRYKEGCDNSGRGKGPLCKKYRLKYDDDDEDDDDKDDDDEGFDVEVEIEDGETKVEFDFENAEYELTVDSTDIDEVLDAIADAINEGDDKDDLDEDLRDAIEEAFEDAKEEATEDFEVEIEIDGGETTLSFTFEDEDYEVTVDSTDEEDVLDAAADAIDSGDDADDLDEDLRDAIEEELAGELAITEEDEEDAEEAIDAAELAIENAQTEVDAAEDGPEKDTAVTLLGEAQDKLADAQEAFDNENYDDAEDLAEEAEELANDAADEL